MRKTTSLIVVACIIIFFTSCANKKNDAVYIYEINGDVHGDVVATLTWDDLNEIRTITALINEANSSDNINPNVEMVYGIELVNSDTDNDCFQIGFIDGMVCCTGNVQGLKFDHSISTTITEKDLLNIIDHDS